jgi:hypothetical protein
VRHEREACRQGDISTGTPEAVAWCAHTAMQGRICTSSADRKLGRAAYVPGVQSIGEARSAEHQLHHERCLHQQTRVPYAPCVKQHAVSAPGALLTALECC